jgi:hypothetical protein
MAFLPSGWNPWSNDDGSRPSLLDPTRWGDPPDPFSIDSLVQGVKNSPPAQAAHQNVGSVLDAGRQVGNTVSNWWNTPSPEPPPVPEPGPSATTAAPAAASPDALDPTTQGLLDARTQQILNESKQKAAEAQLAEARVKELEANIARRNDPNSIESQTAATQLEAAKAALAKSQFEMQQAQSALTPEQQIRLTDQLQRGRAQMEAQVAATQAQLNRDFQASQAQATRDFQIGQADREDARADRKDQLQLQLWQDQKQLRLYEIMLGQEDKAADRAMRQSELDYQRGLDSQKMGLETQRLDLDKQRAAQDFQLRMMAQKVAEGELSAKKAFNKFQQWIEKQRLPSEVARNKSAAYAPFLPYLTNAKEGDIPVGFQNGGPMSRLVEMGGGSYDQGQYAIHPTSIADIQNGVTRPSAPPAPAPAPSAQGNAVRGSSAPMPTPSAAMPNSEVAKQIQQAIGR